MLFDLLDETFGVFWVLGWVYFLLIWLRRVLVKKYFLLWMVCRISFSPISLNPDCWEKPIGADIEVGVDWFIAIQWVCFWAGLAWAVFYRSESFSLLGHWGTFVIPCLPLVGGIFDRGFYFHSIACLLTWWVLCWYCHICNSFLNESRTYWLDSDSNLKKCLANDFSYADFVELLFWAHCDWFGQWRWYGRHR